MKRNFILLLLLVSYQFGFSQSQPNNVDIGLFFNGANGSNSGSGADLEVAFRVASAYTPTPVAEDHVLILVAPISSLAGTETFSFPEYQNIFGSASMILTSTQDIGSNRYFGFALNGASGLNLSLLPTGTWTYAYSIKITPTPTLENLRTFRIIDQVNNSEISTFFGATVNSYLNIGGSNQFTASAFSALPVKISDFNVAQSGPSDARVLWTSDQEISLSHYVIERSSSQNNDWKSIGEVKASGNSQTPINYSFLDKDVYKGITSTFFYRIRSVDLDGKASLTAVRSIRFSGSETRGITIYPNPVKDGFTISIPALSGLPNSRVMLRLANRLGQIVANRQVNNMVSSNYYFDIKSANLPNGEYMLQILSNDELLDTKKIIVLR